MELLIFSGRAWHLGFGRTDAVHKVRVFRLPVSGPVSGYQHIRVAPASKAWLPTEGPEESSKW